MPGIGLLVYIFFLFFDGESDDYDLAEFEIDAPVPIEDEPAKELEFAKVGAEITRSVEGGEMKDNTVNMNKVAVLT